MLGMVSLIPVFGGVLIDLQGCEVVFALASAALPASHGVSGDTADQVTAPWWQEAE